MSKFVVALSSGHVGEVDYVQQGWLYPADDPLVKRLPHLFTDDLESVPGTVHRTGAPVHDAPVEAASAAPGEKRQTRRA